MRKRIDFFAKECYNNIRFEKRWKKYVYGSKKTGNTAPSSRAYMEKSNGVYQKERRILHSDAGGGNHRDIRTARRGISFLFRLENVDLSVLRAGGSLRSAQYTLFYYARWKNREDIQKHAGVYSCFGVHNLFGLYADCQRYGATYLFAAGVLRTLVDG